MADNSKFPDLIVWPANVRCKLFGHLVKDVYSDFHHLEKLHSIWPSLVEDPVVWRRLCYRRWHHVSVYFQPIEIVSSRYQLKNINQESQHQRIKIRARPGEPDQMNVFLDYRQLFYDLHEITEQVNAFNVRNAHKLFRERISCDPLEMLRFLFSTRRVAKRAYQVLVRRILPTVDGLIFNLIQHDPRYPLSDLIVDSPNVRRGNNIFDRLYLSYLRRFYFQGSMRHIRTIRERQEYCQALEKINIYFEEVYNQLTRPNAGGLVRIGQETFNLNAT